MEQPTPATDAPPDAPLASPPAAPAVVAVVVARDPGDWFEEVIGALAQQDYPNLEILVIDAAGADPVKVRVGAAAPGAYVRRLDDDPGFGAAANEVLEMVDGAAFYLLCHDDVALAPDGVRILVEEAYRSNAAVVGPKLVEWDDPRRLLQVGQGMDHAGYGIPLVERGELDQSQHDAVRDVFTVPGPCTLVRADLFGEIGGFDEGIRDFLDDVSLCWRAHIAGGRVIVAPDAVARHRDELALRHGYDERRRIQARHRLRLVLSCYGRLGALRAAVQTAVLNVIEVVYALLAGRPRRAGDIGSSWLWNLRRLGELRVARAQVRRFRRIPDREVRRSMARGSARLTQFLRGQIGKGEDRFTGLARSGRAAAGTLSGGSLRAAAAVWAVIAVVLLAGSRHLITRGVPAVGDLVAFSESPIDLFRAWCSGWRTAGLGSELAAPSAFGLLGGLGTVLLGAMGTLRLLLSVGMIPLGALGAYRLVAPVGSRWAQIACLIVYVTIPLPYNALAAGQWGALVLYAAAPAIVGGLARASGVAPFGGEGSVVPRRGIAYHVLSVGLITALVATIVPVAIVVVPLVAASLALGGLVAIRPQGGLRLLATAVGASLVALVLHLPWSLGLVGSGSIWTAVTGVPTTSQTWDLAALLRFEVGPLGSPPLGWCFLVAAALPLLIGRADRFGWAVRAWTTSVAFFGLAWAAERGDLPFSTPPVDVLLVPAAIGLALATAMGVAAFEVDLPGYRFGWRQVASAVAAGAVVAGIVPVLAASFDGRWSMPAGDHDRALVFIDDENDEIPFRVLWLGDPAALPLQGWELEEGLAYATTDDGAPNLENLWVGEEQPATAQLRQAVALAEDGQTARLGRLLAPMGIRYVVVPERLAPSPFSEDEIPVPDRLATTLSAQLDLAPLDVPAGLTVYRNEAFMPVRAGVPADTAVPTDGGFQAALGIDLSGAPAVLPDDDGRLTWTGTIDDGTTVLHSAASSDRWHLDVDGDGAERVEPFGWASGFEVPVGGDATLSFSTPVSRYALLAAQVLLWLIAIRLLLRRRLGPLGRIGEEDA